jgi:hypothetical protein
MQQARQADDSFVYIVKQSLDGKTQHQAVGNNLSMTSITLDTPAEALKDSRYMWLEFGLPGSSDKIKALGEITDRSTFGVTVKFKHLFPDHKAKLAGHLGVSLN